MNEVQRHPKVIWAAVALLFLLHQDYWLWDARALVLGFLPMGLAYHAAFSLAAAALWALACRWAWPKHIEDWADQTDAPARTAASVTKEGTQ
jgi:hypothetical protein